MTTRRRFMTAALALVLCAVASAGSVVASDFGRPVCWTRGVPCMPVPSGPRPTCRMCGPDQQLAEPFFAGLIALACWIGLGIVIRSAVRSRRRLD